MQTLRIQTPPTRLPLSSANEDIPSERPFFISPSPQLQSIAPTSLRCLRNRVQATPRAVAEESFNRKRQYRWHFGAIAVSLGCPMRFNFWTQICLPTQFILGVTAWGRVRLSVLGY